MAAKDGTLTSYLNVEPGLFLAGEPFRPCLYAASALSLPVQKFYFQGPRYLNAVVATPTPEHMEKLFDIYGDTKLHPTRPVRSLELSRAKNCQPISSRLSCPQHGT